jgi:transposase
MAYALQIHPHESIDELRRVVKTVDDEAQKSRIRAIIELREGARRREVARRTVVDSDTITNWIKAYNRGGVAALKMSRGGRPKGNPKWDPTLFEALAREIDKGERYWSVPCMVAWIRESYGKAIPQSTVWYHVRHLNYSYKSARPHPAKGDPAQHQAFKKGGSAPPSRR